MPDWETVKALGAELPDVVVDRWYGTPALHHAALPGQVSIISVSERRVHA
jgi:hypothetical protein